MSVKFNGFSQDDINKVSKKTGGGNSKQKQKNVLNLALCIFYRC